MRLSRAGITQSNNIVAGDDIFAAREFENKRLVERWNGSEVERVETLHRGKAGGADAALDAPLAYTAAAKNMIPLPPENTSKSSLIVIPTARRQTPATLKSL